MELKSLGTYSMTSGRPIDTVRFTKVSYSHLEYDRQEPGEISEHVVAKIEFDDELRPQFKTAMNALIPIVVDALDLGNTWLQGEIYSLKTQWTWSGDKWLLKINEIDLRREGLSGEIPMQRSVKTGKITEEGFDPFTRELMENIWDEAWIYLKQQPKQGELFEERAELIDRIIAKDVPEEVMENAIAEVVDRKRKAVREKLLQMGVQNYRIEDYLGQAFDSPSVEGFHEWQCEPDQQEQIATPRRTRSKVKKEAVPA